MIASGTSFPRAEKLWKETKLHVRLGWSKHCAGRFPYELHKKNWVEALNCDRKTLKKKWSFSRVIWHKRKTMAQRGKKLTTGLVYWSNRFKSKSKEMILNSNFWIFSSFLVATASAADPAREAVLFRYKAATVSVAVTSHVGTASLPPRRERQSGRLPSALKRPCGYLMQGNPALYYILIVTYKL